MSLTRKVSHPESCINCQMLIFKVGIKDEVIQYMLATPTQCKIWIRLF